MLRRFGLVVVLTVSSLARAEASDVEVFGGLAFWFPRLDTQSENVSTVPLRQIEDFLALPPLEVDPGYVRVLVGLKWKL